MKRKTYLIIITGAVFICAASFLFIDFKALAKKIHAMYEEREEAGRAAESFEWWYGQRAFPNQTIDMKAYVAAFQYSKLALRNANRTNADTSVWRNIGPNNIGGRTLALAINPSNPNVMWAGSASGGLWKTTTAGVGASAWQLIETGFPTVSVSSILINPTNTNEMYIGTGEFRRYNQPGLIGTPGARSTYGIGILKTTDGGNIWSQTALNWTLEEFNSIQKMIFNPTNLQTLYAASSDGVYKTTDGGASWVLSLDVASCIDVVINPFNPQILYATCGQLNSSPNPGIYKTTNGGTSWVKLSGGLPSANFGRTALSLFATASKEIVFAGISDASALNIIGLYKTNNGGATWTAVSTENYASSQGWYDNVVAVHPTDSNRVFCSGLDIYRSTSGGTNLIQKSYWYLGNEGVIEPGGTEGDPTYAHADHHAITFHPTDPNRIFFSTDGGIFESTDGGETFIGRNGGYATTQFYNGFASSLTDSVTAYGGLQDNGTVKYEGSPSWNKVYGGDGGWCAIDPINNNIAYEEYVYLIMAKTTDGGNNWEDISTPGSNSSNANFIAPFTIAPSNGNVLYAGAKIVYKTTTGGSSWIATNAGNALNGNKLASLATSWTNPDTVYAGTGTSISVPEFSNGLTEIFFSSNGGNTWVNRTANFPNGGLPNRYPTDLFVNPKNSKEVYLTYSGFGAPHVFKSTDCGASWINISSNLPDIPVQSVVVDNLFPNHVYIGSDLGVYQSTDGGTSWAEFNVGLPYAMVTDLSISPTNRALRASTFGNAVYERSLSRAVLSTPRDLKQPVGFSLEQNYPNPFNPSTEIKYQVASLSDVKLEVFDLLGRNVATLVNDKKAAGSYQVSFNASKLASGTYFYRFQAKSSAGTFNESKKMILVK